VEPGLSSRASRLAPATIRPSLVPVKERVETVRKYSTVRQSLVAVAIVIAAIAGF